MEPVKNWVVTVEPITKTVFVSLVITGIKKPGSNEDYTVVRTYHDENIKKLEEQIAAQQTGLQTTIDDLKAAKKMIADKEAEIV